MRRVLLIALAAGLAGCGAAPEAPVQRTRAFLSLPTTAALAVDGDGMLLAGELKTGRVLRIDPRTRAMTAPYPVLPVTRDGQRGLLGLTGVGRRVFAAWTRADGHLVVSELRAGRPPILRWRGPQTATLANGGHLATLRDGRIAIGIGDRQTAPRAGRLLALDPDGPATQVPATLSTGWNNPYAFTVTPDGHVWVADNSPGRAPERLARGDADGGRPSQVTPLPGRSAPSGLVALSSRELLVCGFVSGRLDRFRRVDGRWAARGTVARGCRYGAVRLADGRVALSTDAGLRTVRP